MFVIEFLLALLAVDFFSGFLHWLEDSYGSVDTPVIGKYVTAPNRLHHEQPRKFVKSPFWRRNRFVCLLSSVILAITLTTGLFNNFWLYFFILSTMTDEVHCWAHRSRLENGPLINFMQKFGLVRSPKHHEKHHSNQKNTHYCVMTNFLNPFLERIRFFPILEGLLYKLFRISPVSETKLETRC